MAVFPPRDLDQEVAKHFQGTPEERMLLALRLGRKALELFHALAKRSAILYQRRERLERARQELSELRKRLFFLREVSDLARALYRGPLPVWEKTVAGMVRQVEEEYPTQLPNPFRPKDPLDAEQGRALFRGRENLVRTVEALLGELGKGCSIALLGPRRCGKTSLLKMLPLFLPDAICVFFDLQDNPIDSPASFFTALLPCCLGPPGT